MSMSSSVDEEKPRKKLKLACPSQCGLSSLPDDVVLSCVARVSRWDQASLFLASKSFSSLMVSPDLYDLRSLMDCTENFNYLRLSIPPDPNPRWCFFSPKDPNRRRLVPIQSHFYQPPEDSSVVAHDHGIYVIGGSINRRRSTSVLFLDCRSHKWSTLPDMEVARASAAVGVMDGKIFVFGGCEERYSDKWIEVFDPETQTWDVREMPPNEDKEPYYTMMMDSVVVEDKAIGSRLNILFKGKFDFDDTQRESNGWYVIDNVIYCSLTGGKVKWCALEMSESENKAKEWTKVMGLESLKDTLSASKLVNYSEWVGDLWEEATQGRELGWDCPLTRSMMHFPWIKLSSSGSNLLLFWGVLAPQCLEIWCAEISLERCKERYEIRGNIEWSQAVMTLDPPLKDHCKILHTLPINL